MRAKVESTGNARYFRNRLINAGIVPGEGIETKRGQLQSKKERQRILSGLVDHKVYGSAAEAIKPLFDTLDQFSEHVENLEKVLESMAAEDKEVELLQTIPGVGLITAETLRAFIDDINRYSSQKKFGSHMVLAPWVRN